MNDSLPRISAAQLERLKQATGTTTDAALAKALDVSQASISNARKREKVPSGWFATIGGTFSVNPQWLMFGTGPRDKHSIPPFGADEPAQPTTWLPPALVAQLQGDDPWKSACWQDVPVIGFGNCGDSDWYTQNSIALRTFLPISYAYNPELFAVVAMGASMLPAGIEQGFVLFCDPVASIDTNDVIYIERIDGTASVKKFLRYDETHLHIRGWKPAKGEKAPEEYFEQIPRESIKRVVCVTVVKRK